MREDKVYCPLLLQEIDEDICADAAFVAEDFHPKRFAPKEISTKQNWKATCQICKNNPLNGDKNIGPCSVD